MIKEIVGTLQTQWFCPDCKTSNHSIGDASTGGTVICSNCKTRVTIKEVFTMFQHYSF